MGLVDFTNPYACFWYQSKLRTLLDMGVEMCIRDSYPVMYAQTFFEGMKKEGQENIVNLLRCAWA